MIVSDFTLQISGRPGEYRVQLELLGDAESVASIREMLQPVLGNIRLTADEVNTDLNAGQIYVARSLPAQPPEAVYGEDASRA